MSFEKKIVKTLKRNAREIEEVAPLQADSVRDCAERVEKGFQKRRKAESRLQFLLRHEKDISESRCDAMWEHFHEAQTLKAELEQEQERASARLRIEQRRAEAWRQEAKQLTHDKNLLKESIVELIELVESLSKKE